MTRSRAVRKYQLHAHVRGLAGDIIRAQHTEIRELQDWLVAWYAR